MICVCKKSVILVQVVGNRRLTHKTKSNRFIMVQNYWYCFPNMVWTFLARTKCVFCLLSHHCQLLFSICQWKIFNSLVYAWIKWNYLFSSKNWPFSRPILMILFMNLQQWLTVNSLALTDTMIDCEIDWVLFISQ